VARLVAWLHERAEGNAFFTTQLLRALEDDNVLRQSEGGWALGDLAAVGLPAPLRQVLDARMDRLGAEARRLLTLAAVIGQEVPLALWAAVAETDEDGLLDTIERAVEARLLAETSDGQGVRFAHALVREALYEGTLVVRRRRIHRRVAEERLGDPASDPDAVADHFRRAADPRAAEWLVAAGAQAQRAYAWLTAADRYEVALGLLESQGTAPGERGWILYRLARLARYADPVAALAYAEHAQEAAAVAGDALLLAQAKYAHAGMLCFAGDFRRGLAELEANAAAPDPLIGADPARVAEFQHLDPLRGRDEQRATLAQWSAALGLFERARALVPGIADTPLTTLAFLHAGRGEAAEAARYFALARARQRAVGDHRQLGFLSFHELIGVALPYRADRAAEVRGVLAELEASWARSGGVMPGEWVDLAALPGLILAGRWAEARRLVSAGQIAHPSVATVAAALLGPLARYQGDAPAAWSLIRTVLPEGASTELGGAWYFAAQVLQRLAAGLALDAGDLPVARAWLAAQVGWLAQSGSDWGRAELQLGWAAYHRSAGDPARARHSVQQALTIAAEPRQPLALLGAHRLLGEVDMAEGHHADAAAHLAAALMLADACAAPYERALTLLALAELHFVTGDRPQTTTALAGARAILEPLEARPALARAGALAARMEMVP
jgi:hypothetical protein